MKRYILVLILLVSAFGVLSAAPLPPAQVTITLATKVPEFLSHGFLLEGSDVIESSINVGDAFTDTGAQFTYSVRTNISSQLTITAEVTPFLNSSADEISVKNIFVRQAGVEAVEAPAKVTGPGSSGNTYELFTFTPSIPGMAIYSYELRVVADQDELAAAPTGEYVSTVSIGIKPEN